MRRSEAISSLATVSSALALLFLVSRAQPSLGTPAATSEPLRFEVKHGLGSFHRQQSLVPLSVLLENRSVDDRTLRVQASWEEAGCYPFRDVELPSGSRKELTLLVGPLHYVGDITVQLLDGERVVGEQRPTSTPTSAPERLVGILGSQPMGLGEVEAEEGAERRLAFLDGDTLPERVEGLESLDLLIWPDPLHTRLRASQRLALAQWLSEGGEIVVFMRDLLAEGARDAVAEFTSAVPTRLESSRELQSLGLALPEETTLALLDPGRGDVWLREPGGAVAVSESRGLGRVVALGIDPRDRGLRLAGPADLWRQLLLRLQPPSTLSTETAAQRLAYNENTLDLPVAATSFLSDDSLSRPPWFWLALLLGLYLVAIGPLDFLVLKRASRLPWTWATYPALAAVFSLAGFGLATLSHSRSTTLKHIVQLDLVPHSQWAREATYGSLFVTEAGDYRLVPRGANALTAVIPNRTDGLDPRTGRYRAPPSRLDGRQVGCDQSRVEVAAPVPKWGFLSASFVQRVETEAGVVGRLSWSTGGLLSGFLVPSLGRDLDMSWLLLVVDGELYGYELGPLRDGVPRRLDRQAADDVGRTVVSLRDLEPGAAFAELLKQQTARRLLLDSAPEEDDWEDRYAWSRLLRDPHPHLDWSTFLERGQAVLVGYATDTSTTLEVEKGGRTVDASSVNTEGALVIRALIASPPQEEPPS